MVSAVIIISTGFLASLAMTSPDDAAKEARRSVKELGAKGIQLYTNVVGKALDAPEFLPVFEEIRAALAKERMDYPDNEATEGVESIGPLPLVVGQPGSDTAVPPEPAASWSAYT